MPSPSVQRGPGSKPAVAWAPEPRVAVLVNVNARQVSPRILRTLSHVVAEQDLFLSRSPLEARGIARRVIEGGYDTVFCGGGDGTFIGFANEILVEAQRARATLPRFGILRLGTGNGLAGLLHASRLRGDGILDDVLRARAGEVPHFRKLNLIQVGNQRTPFAGVGVDGQILNDFMWVKQHWAQGITRRLFSGRGGYFSAGLLRTIPHYVTHPLFAECEVINGPGAPAYRLDKDGGTLSEHAPGSVLYKGRVMIASVSTIPFYGFGFKMFPFADRRRGMMQLRLGSLSAGEVVTHLPQLWRGEYFPGDRIQDFHVREATLRFDRPMPLQVGGDAQGQREQVTFSVSPEQLELLDFTPAARLSRWQ